MAPLNDPCPCGGRAELHGQLMRACHMCGTVEISGKGGPSAPSRATGKRQRAEAALHSLVGRLWRHIRRRHVGRFFFFFRSFRSHIRWYLFTCDTQVRQCLCCVCSRIGCVRVQSVIRCVSSGDYCRCRFVAPFFLEFKQKKNKSKRVQDAQHSDVVGWRLSIGAVDHDQSGLVLISFFCSPPPLCLLFSLN